MPMRGRRLAAERRSAANNLPVGTFAWNGLLSPVSTVPGCMPTQIASGRDRATSIASVLIIMFSAALDAR